MYLSRYVLLIGLLICSDAAVADKASGLPMRLVLGYLPPINCENTMVGARCVNNKVAERLQYFSGVHIKTQLVPYARAVRMLESGQADIGLMLENDKVSDNVVPVAKVYGIVLSIYTRADVDHLTHEQLRVGVLRGQGDNIIGRIAGARQIELAEYQQGVEMLALGRLDAVLGPDETLMFLFGQYQMSHMLNPQPLVQFGQEVWLYCRRDSCGAQRLRQLQKAIDDVQPEMPGIMQVAPAAYYE
jgi:ABC-type amino acid transport substrate-binding protein